MFKIRADVSKMKTKPKKEKTKLMKKSWLFDKINKIKTLSRPVVLNQG